jgi:hypothetical protein
MQGYAPGAGRLAHTVLEFPGGALGRARVASAAPSLSVSGETRFVPRGGYHHPRMAVRAWVGAHQLLVLVRRVVAPLFLVLALLLLRRAMVSHTIIIINHNQTPPWGRTFTTRALFGFAFFGACRPVTHSPKAESCDLVQCF